MDYMNFVECICTDCDNASLWSNVVENEVLMWRDVVALNSHLKQTQATSIAKR